MTVQQVGLYARVSSDQQAEAKKQVISEKLSLAAITALRNQYQEKKKKMSLNQARGRQK